MNPRGINCLRVFNGMGAGVWGSHTLATDADPEWRYVPMRRTALMIERSNYHGIQCAQRRTMGTIELARRRAGKDESALADKVEG